MGLTATVTTTQAIKLAPKLRTKLVSKLGAYAKLVEQRKELDAQIKALQGDLDVLREETGEQSLKLEGHGTITLVAGTYKKFNEKKFVSLGGDLEVYQQAIEERPKKPFVKVTLPGEHSEEE